MEASAKTVTFGKTILPSSLNFRLPRLKVLDVGSGTSQRVYDFYPDADVFRIDKKFDWDVLEKGLPKGEWDVIFANHFIEHIDDPDFFLEECKKVMKPYTILDIGTPNLNAWFNRIFFLFGYLPHSYEVSYYHNFGKPFDWNKEEIGGHIRVFNVQSLLDLLKAHKFVIKSLEGELSQFPCALPIRLVDKALTWLSPTLASSFRVKCTYLY